MVVLAGSSYRAAVCQDKLGDPRKMMMAVLECEGRTHTPSPAVDSSRYTGISRGPQDNIT